MSGSLLLGAVVHRRVAALHRHLPAALGGEPEAVHQARVASRRLRELLPAMVSLEDGGIVERAQRAMRRVTRALGPVREVDVALALLDEHLAAHADQAAEGEVVRAWLLRLRSDRRDAMLDLLDETHVARLWKRVDALRELGAAPADHRGAIRRDVANRLQRRGKTLAEEVARTGVLYAPEPLHAVRIATKKLRYAIELAGDLKLAPTVGAVRSLKRLQDLLGRIHDLEVLVNFADRACAEATRRVNAARLVGDWHRESRELHASYLRSRTALAATATTASTTLAHRVAKGRPPRAREQPSQRRRPASRHARPAPQESA